MITAVTVALAVTVVVLSLLDLWASAKKFFDLAAFALTAELAAIVGLLALSVSARDWWLVALWAAAAAIAAWNLRAVNRKRRARAA